MDTENPNIIIDRLGGTSATARIFGIDPASVSEWRNTKIPKARLMYLRLARPEVFAVEPPPAPAKRRRAPAAPP